MALGGLPSVEETIDNPVGTFLFFDAYGACSVGVNIFVLISGWFGIKLRAKSFAKLVFQVLFFTILVFAILVAFDREKYLNLHTLSYVFLIPEPQLWFVKAYIVLLLFSPILNSYVENTTQKQLGIVIICFYVFQTIYGWLFLDSTPWFGGGYSPLSFFGLYLLARYLRIYPKLWYQWGFSKLTGLFLIMIFVLSIVSTLVTYYGFPIAGRLYAYSSPFMVCGATLLLIAFSRLSFHSRIINWIAMSSFAVYLTHGHEIILRGYYAPFIGQLYNHYHGLVFISVVFLFIFVVFFTSIIIDKVRLTFWDYACKQYQK